MDLFVILTKEGGDPFVMGCTLFLVVLLILVTIEERRTPKKDKFNIK